MCLIIHVYLYAVFGKETDNGSLRACLNKMMQQQDRFPLNVYCVMELLIQV